jgi:N-glycosylase/DNA lyase
MAATKIIFQVPNYNLDATLESGQVFLRKQQDNAWIGVINRRWVRLTQKHYGICAETAEAIKDWRWLRDYLQMEVDLNGILKTFPNDKPLHDAIIACRGLRVLRQDPWECLASFILSSTKQIVQIRQIVSLLCERFGEEVVVPQNEPPAFAFPSPEKIASLTEAQLRGCKMGFRAPHLLIAAQQIAEGKFNLEKIRKLNYSEARMELMKLRGVGKKIADCVLLFAYGFDSAFPVDVWIERALQKLYFPRRPASEKRMRHFAATHFGPHSGYAQQYLFHYMRTKLK